MDKNHKGGHLGLGSLDCKTTQEDLNVCGNLIGFFPLFRTLQDSLIFSSNGAEIVLSGRSLTFVL